MASATFEVGSWYRGEWLGIVAVEERRREGAGEYVTLGYPNPTLEAEVHHCEGGHMVPLSLHTIHFVYRESNGDEYVLVQDGRVKVRASSRLGLRKI